MAVDAGEFLDEERRPYAAAANVISVLERVRRINLPETIDADFMRVVGVPEASRARVVFALRYLRLIDAAGRPTDALRSIARASAEEYRDQLGAVVRTAYAVDLERVDPGQDTQVQIMSAFQRYEPRSQTMRMVMLFLGLCRAAGIPVLDAPRQRTTRADREGARRAGRQGAIRHRQARDESHTPASFTPSTGQAVTINLEDLALIEDEQAYALAWKALGEVNRAVAKARQAAQARAQSDAATEEGS